MGPIQESAPDTISFDLPGDQNYACRDCPSKCCRFPWHINITDEELTRYRQTPWIQAHLKSHGTDFQQAASLHVMPTVPQPDGGHGCVFLDPDGLCRMQKTEGHDFIPATCQTYPFGLLAADQDGKPRIQPTISFVCRSILHNYGDPLESIAQEKYDNVSRYYPPVSLPERLSAGGIPLERESYLALLDAWRILFTRPDVSAVSGLLAVYRSLWSLISENLGGGLSGPGLTQALEAALSDAGIFERPAVSPGSLAGRTLVAITLCRYIDGFQDNRPLGPAGKMARIPALMGLIAENGSARFWDFPKPVDFRQARGLALDENAPDIQGHLKRYYTHLFFNKATLIKGDDLLKAVFQIGISYPAILRMARYRAAAFQHEAVTGEDVLEAIGYVDGMISMNLKTDNLVLNAKETIIQLLSAQPGSFERVLLSESGSGAGRA